MKMIKRISLLCLLFLVTGSLTGTRRAMAQPGVSVSFQAFYDELAPYGQWINYGGYGRVWIPRVESDFQPYGSRGQWVVTDYGNTWVSDYDWGWAPFHYGRWLLDDRYGWIWVPGSDWGPAWVSWRSGGGYYGWAPLGPGVDVNINIDIPLLRWIFVPQRYITSRSVYSYCMPRGRSVNIYRSTTVINNIYVNNNRRYFYGPQRHDIENATRRRVTVHHIDNMDRPGRAMASNGSLRLYRPEFRDRDRPDRNNYSYWNNRSPRDNREPGRYENRPDRSSPSRDNGSSDYNRQQERDRFPRGQNDGERPQASPGRWNTPQQAPNAGDQRNNDRQRESPERGTNGQDQSPRYRERSEDNNRREESRQPQSTPAERPQRPERSRPSDDSRNSDRENSSRERSERPSRSGGRSVRM